MQTIIALLQQDHVDFVKLLNALETQAKLVAYGSDFDHPFVQSVIAYFKGYPRHLHYRREAILLKLLDRRAPELASKITTILRYHRTLDMRLTDLENCFKLFEADAEAGRVPFVTAAYRFAEFEKSHFVDEDKYLLPVALQVLSTADLNDESPEFRWNVMADDAPLPPLPQMKATSGPLKSDQASVA